MPRRVTSPYFTSFLLEVDPQREGDGERSGNWRRSDLCRRALEKTKICDLSTPDIAGQAERTLEQRPIYRPERLLSLWKQSAKRGERAGDPGRAALSQMGAMQGVRTGLPGPQTQHARPLGPLRLSGILAR